MICHKSDDMYNKCRIWANKTSKFEFCSKKQKQWYIIRPLFDNFSLYVIKKT